MKKSLRFSQIDCQIIKTVKVFLLTGLYGEEEYSGSTQCS